MNDLWRRLDGFRFDDPQAGLTFTQRLARENGWTVGYAHRVVQEYRCFLYLAMTAGIEVTPSDQVDQAWHLHLTYTRSYWHDLCGEVLGEPLHHGPTRGTSSDGERYREQYAQTLLLYRELLGHEPPADIWPPVEERFGNPARFVRVDRQRYWLLPRPWAHLARPAWPQRHAVALAGVPVLVSAVANPLDWQGGEFLAFYVPLAIASVVLAYVLRRMLREGDNRATEPLDRWQVACLRGGVEGAIQAATVELVKKRSLKVGPLSPKGQGREDFRLWKRDGAPPGESELEERILAISSDTLGVRCGELAKHAQPAAEKIHQQLQDWGLLLPRWPIPASRWVPVALLLMTVSLGVAKFGVGLDRGRPVGWLLLALVLLVMAVVLFARAPHRTRAGDAELKRLREEHTDLRYLKPKEKRSLEPADLALATGLYGLTVVVGSDTNMVAKAWALRNGPATGGGGGGCGGGDGGGCGGGGCGGCGGCG